MNNDEGIDLVGVGKIAKAIPKVSWNKLVSTACDTFIKTIAPITATTEGLGKLIEAKFDKLSEIEKLYAAATLSKAKEKIDLVSQKLTGIPKAPILIKILENSAIETDETISELWANLLAQEFITGNVHPEFIRILERLSSNDAQILAEIAEKNNIGYQAYARYLLNVLKPINFGMVNMFAAVIGKEDNDFSYEHLKRLGLITVENTGWYLSKTGEAFIEAVNEPKSISEDEQKTI